MRDEVRASLICPDCRGRLAGREPEGLECRGCQGVFRIEHGVPRLYPREVLRQIRAGPKAPAPRREDVLAMARTISAEPQPELVEAIAQAYAEALRIQPSACAKVNEIACFYDRFVNQPAPPGAAARRLAPFPARARRLLAGLQAVRARLFPRPGRAPTAQFLAHYVPPALERRRLSFHNIRLKNLDQQAWPGGTGPQALRLSYHWLARDGRVVVQEGLRSYFPVDVKAGHEISLPLQVEANVEAGEYVLQVGLVREGVGWFDEAAQCLRIPVRVVDQLPADPDRARVVVRQQAQYDYAQDHEYGRHLLAAKSGELGRPLETRQALPLRVLEIGCGCTPQIAHFAPNIVGVAFDISYPLLQVARAILGVWGMPLDLIAGDGERLPFAEASFDITVCFAALHHFADPIHFLSEMGRVTKPGGMVGAFCEPVSSELSAAQELQAGLNEQVFLLEEYLEFYRRAGLRVHSGELLRGSLHLIGTKASG